MLAHAPNIGSWLVEIQGHVTAGGGGQARGGACPVVLVGWLLMVEGSWRIVFQVIFLESIIALWVDVCPFPTHSPLSIRACCLRACTTDTAW